MKVSVTVQFTADDALAGDIVIQNLKDVGFEQHINENGYMRLSFDGDVFNNDLAYGGYPCSRECSATALRDRNR